MNPCLHSAYASHILTSHPSESLSIRPHSLSRKVISMRWLRVMPALLVVAMPLSAQAQKTGHATTGTNNKANANANANVHNNPNAAAQQREMMRQQELMNQQQQAFEREQMRQLEQQQQAMQLQAREQQQMLLQHLRSMQQSGGAGTNSAQAFASNANSGSSASVITGPSGNGKGGKNHSGTAVAGTSGTSSHKVVRRSVWYVWPRSSTAAYRHLTALKLTLDSIVSNRQQPVQNSNASQNGNAPQNTAPPNLTALQNTLQNRLYAVHNTSATTPAQAHVRQLAGDLTAALSGRAASGNPVDTRALALHLRAMMNTPYLNVSEFQESLNEQRTVLNKANVPVEQTDKVVQDVYSLAEDVLNRSL